MSRKRDGAPAGRRDKDQQQVIIGEVTPHNATVAVDYDAEWPELFRAEADRIEAALGAVALRPEHVGSAALPGLPAKPVIDIVLAVADSADEPSYRSAARSGRVRAPRS